MGTMGLVGDGNIEVREIGECWTGAGGQVGLEEG